MRLIWSDEKVCEFYFRFSISLLILTMGLRLLPLKDPGQTPVASQSLVRSLLVHVPVGRVPVSNGSAFQGAGMTLWRAPSVA